MYRGFFINLDRNTKRRTAVEQNLTDVGLANVYQRVPAVDGRALGPEYVTELDRGNLGLWLTHERLLAAHRSSTTHLHLMEDDALLPADAKHCLNDMLDKADNHPQIMGHHLHRYIPATRSLRAYQLLSQAK